MAYTTLYSRTLSGTSRTYWEPLMDSAPIKQFSDGTFLLLCPNPVTNRLDVVHGNAAADTWTLQTAVLGATQDGMSPDSWVIDNGDYVHILEGSAIYYLKKTGATTLTVVQSKDFAFNGYGVMNARYYNGWSWIFARNPGSTTAYTMHKVNESTAHTSVSITAGFNPTWPFTETQERERQIAVVHDGDGRTWPSGEPDFVIVGTAADSASPYGRALAYAPVSFDHSTGAVTVGDEHVFWYTDAVTQNSRVNINAHSADDIMGTVGFVGSTASAYTYGYLGATDITNESHALQYWLGSVAQPTDEQFQFLPNTYETDLYENGFGMVHDPSDDPLTFWLVAANAVWGVKRTETLDGYTIAKVAQGDLNDRPTASGMWHVGQCPHTAAGGQILSVVVGNGTVQIWSPYSIAADGELWGRIIV